MNLLIFFAIVLSTIILAIVLQRIIHCPILVGFAFFAIYLIVAAVLENTTLVIVAIILGIIAFFAAFIDCLITNSEWLRDNDCLNCRNNNCGGNGNNNSNNNSDDALTIVNSNGDVVARINGNSVNCNNNDNCGCGNRNTSTLLAGINDTNLTNDTSSCGYCNRGYNRMR